MLPDVSPLRQYSWRERDQKVTRPLGERAAQGLGIHPAEHEHLARVPLLDDRRDQSVGVEGDARDALVDRLAHCRHLPHRDALGDHAPP